MEQMIGAGIGTVVVLAYVLLLEAVTAAIVMLGQFLVLQVRALRSLVEPPSTPPPLPTPTPIREPAPELPPDQQVVIGGGIKKWD
jgi:hypothetical protein